MDRRLIANDRLSRRERLGLVRIFEALRVEGYQGGYDAVRRYDQARRRKQGKGSSDAFVPLTFAPGEAYQFDWSHEIVVLRGVTTTIKVAQVRLCHSRMLFVRAYPRETQAQRIRCGCSTRTTRHSRFFVARANAASTII